VLLGAVAIYLDLWIEWAIAVVSIWSLFAAGLQYYLARNIGTTPDQENLAEKPLQDPLYNHKWTIVFFIAASFLTMLLTQIDIFIVQHKFFWDQAWNYVAVSILAKFVFFLAGSIQTVYYPQLAKNKAHTVSHKQLRNYFLLLLLLIVVSLGWASLFGTDVLYLFKAHLVDYSWWLAPLIISSGGLFFFTTIFKLLISRQEFSRAYLLVGLALLSMARLHFAPSTLESFVSLYMRTMIALCGGAGWCFLSVLRKKKSID
jgi:O-antigen/teichoic acid export membrane protein